jgi:nitrite reductase/ring-hydroxylating ferredoxin subunit
MTKKRTFIAKKNDVRPDEILTIDVHGVAFAIAQILDQYYTFMDRCPHRDYPLSRGYLQEGTLICELHGRKYNLRTGECLRPVGAQSLSIYQVFEEGDDLYIDLEEEFLPAADLNPCRSCVVELSGKRAS